MPQRPLAVELTTRLYTEVRPDEVCNENRCYQKRKDSRITRFDLIWLGVRLRNGWEVLGTWVLCAFFLPAATMTHTANILRPHVSLKESERVERNQVSWDDTGEFPTEGVACRSAASPACVISQNALSTCGWPHGRVTDQRCLI